MNLTREAERLAAENGAMQSHLELLVRHLDGMQQENQTMKSMLLQMCNANGINADMQQLNQTIAMHQPAQVRRVGGVDRGMLALWCCRKALSLSCCRGSETNSCSEGEEWERSEKCGVQ